MQNCSEDKWPKLSSWSVLITVNLWIIADREVELPRWLSDKESTCNAGDAGSIPKSTCVRRRQWHPTPVLLPGKSHGWRSLVGCSPWGLEESDTTEWLHFHFSLSCIGEGNGSPLQCSCLENPRDGGAWCAAIYGVAQSRTRLKWLSSSSSSRHVFVYGNYMYCISLYTVYLCMQYIKL